MANIKGVIAGPEFLASISSAYQQNLIGTGDGQGCANCGGCGVIVHTAVLFGPDDEPPVTASGQSAILGQGGWYSAKSTTSPCPLCSGNREELATLLLSSSGVPMEHRTKTLSFLENKPGKETLLNSTKELIQTLPDIHGLYTFYGGHGTGKSTAAMIAVVEACRAGIKAKYTTAYSIATEIKATWNNPEISDQDVLDGIMRNKLLVIDELDRVNRYDETGIHSLVDERYRLRGELATILITNDNITSSAGDQYIKSRMADGIIARVTGGDMRHV